MFFFVFFDFLDTCEVVVDTSCKLYDVWFPFSPCDQVFYEACPEAVVEPVANFDEKPLFAAQPRGKSLMSIVHDSFPLSAQFMEQSRNNDPISNCTEMGFVHCLFLGLFKSVLIVRLTAIHFLETNLGVLLAVKKLDPRRSNTSCKMFSVTLRR